MTSRSVYLHHSYKQILVSINTNHFTIYDSSDSSAYCMMWDENKGGDCIWHIKMG